VSAGDAESRLRQLNPATGEELDLSCGPERADVDAAVRRAQRRSGTGGTDRSSVDAYWARADLLRRGTMKFAESRTRDTARIQETSCRCGSGGRLSNILPGCPGIAGEHVDLGPAAFGYTGREPLECAASRLELSAADRLLEIRAGLPAATHDLQAGRTDAADGRRASENHAEAGVLVRVFQCAGPLEVGGR